MKSLIAIALCALALLAAAAGPAAAQTSLADLLGRQITAPGHNVDYYEITPTVEYKIWRGLIGRLVYRHDQASTKSFSLQTFSTTPTSRVQDTFSVALSYVFF